MVSKAKETNENEEILRTLIKSYENLEEKLGFINKNIDKLELQVSGGFGKEKKKE